MEKRETGTEKKKREQDKAATKEKVVTRTKTERVVEYGPVKPPLKDDPNFILKVFLGVVGIAVISFAMFLAEQVLVIPFFWIAVIVYSAACLKNITVKEKGVKETLSTLDEEYMYTGGYYWRWFLFQRFHLFSTEPLIINIPRQDVVTAEEIIITSEGKRKVYSEAKIGIDAVLYAFWSNTPMGLCEACRKAPNPFDKDKLYEFFEPSLAAMIRGVAADYSWLRVRMNDRDYVDALQKEVRDNKEGPISKACITDFSIENKEVKLPLELNKLITAEQEAVYEKAAGEIKAELKKIEIIKEGEGNAEATEILLKVMDKYPEAARYLTQQKMAQGPASTIFYEIPKGGDELAQKISSLLKVMSKSERASFEDKLVELTKGK